MSHEQSNTYYNLCACMYILNAMHKILPTATLSYEIAIPFLEFQSSIYIAGKTARQFFWILSHSFIRNGNAYIENGVWGDRGFAWQSSWKFFTAFIHEDWTLCSILCANIKIILCHIVSNRLLDCWMLLHSDIITINYEQYSTANRQHFEFIYFVHCILLHL